MEFGKQRGAGLWGTIFVLAVLGFMALVTVKVLPIYLNQMKVTAAVKDISANGGLHGGLDPESIREGFSRHWDIDDVSYIDPGDIHVVRESDGLHLKYSYDARTHLFYNVYVVLHFQDDVRMQKQRPG